MFQGLYSPMQPYRWTHAYTLYYVTYSNGVFADKSLQTTGAVADGKGGAILHIGARFAAVVAMVNSYMYIREWTGYLIFENINLSLPEAIFFRWHGTKAGSEYNARSCGALISRDTNIYSLIF
jgi:ammonia channel protein AmtB